MSDNEIVSTCVDYCVQLENTELLFGRLWDLVSESEVLKAGYLRALEGPLLDGSLPPRLPPLIAQHLVALYDHEERMDSLQSIAVLLDVDCLDIHQVRNRQIICGKNFLRQNLRKFKVGEGTLPWAIFRFRIFLNYFSQKFENSIFQYMRPHVSNHICLYKFMRTRVGSPFTDIENAP